MNKAATLKYGVITSLKNILPFYATLVTLLIFFSFISMGSSKGSLGSWDMMAMFAAIGIGAQFTERFHFLLQNGYSRTTIFINFLVCFLFMAVFMSLFEVFAYYFSQAMHINYNPMFNSLYEMRYASQQVSMIWDSFLWHIFANFCIMTISLLGTILYYRSSKTLRVIIFIVLPVALFLGFPIINITLFDGVFLMKIFNFIIDVLGISQADPYLAMATFTVTSIITLGSAYFLLKRTNIQK